MTLPQADILGVRAREQNPHLNLNTAELWESFCSEINWQHSEQKANRIFRQTASPRSLRPP